ncbi:histidine phosphatase family protein [Schaalia suimastitidis]|uniref:histidine phosphatase family protein n=1 Tax=Schaalia suimastitidis TaxID=121163 RepID=UPI0006840C33|nr:histidine phosphatase family protein [Schaalia suimastitidis]
MRIGARRVVFLRHGQTDFNVDRRFQGVIDKPLNDRGRLQAQQAATLFPDWLATRATQVSFSEVPTLSREVKVISSPLSRAFETASIVAAGCTQAGLTVGQLATDSRLIERSYGVMEGLTVAEAEGAYPQWFQQWRETGECLEADIEDSALVGRRMVEAATEYASEGADGSALLVVGHGSAITRAVITMLGLSPLTFDALRGLENCHWSELVHVGGGGSGASGAPAWRLAAHNVGASICA